MKTYRCVCGQIIFFQNVACVNCKRELGFLPDALLLTSIEPAGDDRWRPTAKEAHGTLYKKCANYTQQGVCNWMIPIEDSEAFCRSCRLNEIIPDLHDEQNRDRWRQLEHAKQRLVYSLMGLKLPLADKKRQPDKGLGFRFLADVVTPDGNRSPIMTGHDHGTITLNVSEADDITREKIRHEMNEPYRTLLGHFRHEIGHYYWTLLVQETGFLEPFRSLFGDEKADYAAALQEHYKSGPAANWQDAYISAYATAHPWEDWAETWAHFLHIQDVLETAGEFGIVGRQIRLDPSDTNGKLRHYSCQMNFDEVILAWSELAVALNSINRSMGLSDLYPFILSPPVIAKLRFVYEVIAASGQQKAAIAATDSGTTGDAARGECKQKQSGAAA